jgi:NADH:ubiquinone oxidoreductase subunit 5 (subunit L)/multisubunit Na+/H+ antiporter MnhA subunit
LGEHKDHHRFDSIHESPWVMTVPLIGFAVLSFFAFYSFNPFGAASGWFYHAVERPETAVPAAVAAAGNEMFEGALHQAHFPAMLLSLGIAGLGILVAFLTYYWKKINADAVASAVKPVHQFLLNKWYFDELYEAVFVNGTKGLTRVLNWIDAKIIDGLVNGTARWTYALTKGTRETWEEGRAGAIVYMVVIGAVSLYTGWVAGSALLPSAVSIAGMIGYGILALAVAGLTFFLFYVGVGGFDNKVVDGLVNLVAYLAGSFGLLGRKFQTGRIQTYLALEMFAVLVFFLWFR